MGRYTQTRRRGSFKPTAFVIVLQPEPPIVIRLAQWNMMVTWTDPLNPRIDAMRISTSSDDMNWLIWKQPSIGEEASADETPQVDPLYVRMQYEFEGSVVGIPSSSVVTHLS